MGVSALVAAIVLAMAGAGVASASTGSSGIQPKPNAPNELDCNGWSSVYQAVKPDFGGLCTDPITVKNGKGTRFVDNGWYVGHDEPSIKFISNKPGSGNQMTYFMQLPIDPAATPTASGSVTDYGELSVAPWFGLPICDPNSYPQNPCKPDSDKNTGLGAATDAGSAFLELQLYPPGFTPFIDSESCSKTKWCSALTIDSLECTFGFATCNPDLRRARATLRISRTNGVPTGPPNPQLTDVSTFLPNRGDVGDERRRRARDLAVSTHRRG